MQRTSLMQELCNWRQPPGIMLLVMTRIVFISNAPLIRDQIGQNRQASIRKQKLSTFRPMTRLSSNYDLAECRRLIDPVFVLFNRVRSERATTARSVTPASVHRAIGRCPCSVTAKTAHDVGDSRTGPITALIGDRARTETIGMRLFPATGHITHGGRPDELPWAVRTARREGAATEWRGQKCLMRGLAS